MSRNLTASFIQQLEAGSKTVIVLYEGEFTTGTVYLWSGIGNIEYDGNTWVGVGTLAGIESIKETNGIKANGVRVTLSGIDATLRSAVLDEVRQGNAGTIYIGFLDDTGAIVSDPAVAFDGFLDVPNILDNGKDITISIAYESRLRDLERVRELRYTNESQQIRFPGDKGFEYVASLQDWNGKWGKA